MDEARAVIITLTLAVAGVPVPVGTRWAVAGEGTRPNSSARRAAAAFGTDSFAGFTRCAGCGIITADDTGEEVDGFAVAVWQSDRAANDLPAFTITDAAGAPARAGYCRAVCLTVCPACNGSPRAREVVADALTVAAVHRLERYAPRA